MGTQLLELSRGLLRFTVEIEGDDDVRIGLSRAAEQIKDWTPFWSDYFAPKFYADIAQNFATQGRLVGGWPALSPAYAAWKANHFPGQPLMRLTDDLYRSLSWSGTGPGPGGVFEAGADSLNIGTTIAYAEKHQRGEGRLPKRQIVFIANADDYRQLLQRWVRATVRGATHKDAAA
jgi:phage gpG-like protein